MAALISTHVCPPIPIRSHDWSAFYDGQEEGPVGWGATKDAAITDLLAQKETDENLSGESEQEASDEGQHRAQSAGTPTQTATLPTVTFSKYESDKREDGRLPHQNAEAHGGYGAADSPNGRGR